MPFCILQDWQESDLAKWVARQRVARAQGGLSEERLQVLYAMGFEFGEVAQLTDEWEAKFDQLFEWLLWQVSCCTIPHLLYNCTPATQTLTLLHHRKQD